MSENKNCRYHEKSDKNAKKDQKIQKIILLAKNGTHLTWGERPVFNPTADGRVI